MARTIRNTLFEAEHAGYLDHGGEAYVFDFPKDLNGLKPYLMRRELEFDPALLSYTTALVPPKRLIGGMNVGQPLLQLEGYPQLTVMARQPGISLAKWNAMESTRLQKEHPGTPYIHRRVEMDFSRLISQFDVARGNPFVKIFDESYRLGMLGYTADSALGNIFIDPASDTLGLVDQLSKSSSPGNERLAIRNVEKFVKAFTPDALTTPEKEAMGLEQVEAWQQKKGVLLNLLVEAQSSVIAAHALDSARPVQFAAVNSVEAISLNAPPHALVTRLQQIASQAHIPSP